MQLIARLVLGDCSERACWITLELENLGPEVVSVINPDVGVPPPQIGWRHSIETYRVAVLSYLGVLEMDVRDSDGRKRPETGPNPWVTPFAKPRLELAPTQKMQIRINLADHFDLTGLRGGSLRLRYGDALARAEVVHTLDVASGQRPPEPT